MSSTITYNMKNLTLFLLASLLALSSFAQTQGTAIRATNGVAFGTLTVQGHVDGTNTSVTNKLLGKFVTGAGNTPAGAFGIVGGVNNQSGQNGITVGAGNLVSAANALSGGRSNSIGSDAVNSISAGFLNTGSGQNSYVNGESNNGGGQDGFIHGSRITVNSGIAGVDHNFLTGQRYSLQDGTSNTFVWSVGSPVLALDGSDSGAFYINSSNKIVLLGAPIYGNGLGLTNIPGTSITTPFVGVSGAAPYVVSNLWSVVLPDGATAFQLGNPGAGYAAVFATNFLVTPDGAHYAIFTQNTNTLFGGDIYVTNGVYHGKSFRPQLVAATIVGATAQSTNLMEIQDGSSNVLASVTASGIFTGNGAGLTNLGTANVKDFGAKGDTNTDDTVAVQAAVDSNKGIIFFPPGWYKLSQTILVKRPLIIRGSGPLMNGTLLWNTNNVPLIYCDGATNKAGHVSIEDFDFVSTGDGIVLDFCVDSTVSRVAARFGTQGRAFVNNGGYSSTFYSCIATENDEDPRATLGIVYTGLIGAGFWMGTNSLGTGANACNLISCIAQGCKYGIHAYESPTHNSYSTVVGGTYEGNNTNILVGNQSAWQFYGIHSESGIVEDAVAIGLANLTVVGGNSASWKLFSVTNYSVPLQAYGTFTADSSSFPAPFPSFPSLDVSGTATNSSLIVTVTAKAGTNWTVAGAQFGGIVNVASTGQVYSIHTTSSSNATNYFPGIKVSKTVSSSSYGPGILFNPDWGTPNFGAGMIAGKYNNNIDNQGDLLFFAHADADGNSETVTEYMRILGNGKVGIGTPSPAAKLDVAGDFNSTTGTRTFTHNSTHTVITNTATLTGNEWTSGQEKYWFNGATTITVDKTNGTISAKGLINGAYGSLAMGTGAVTIASGTLMTNVWSYSSTSGSIGVETNTTLVVTNAGNYFISFGSLIAGANTDVLNLKLVTNGVPVNVVKLSFTCTAQSTSETGFKEFAIALPAMCRVGLNPTNTLTAANMTIQNTVLNVKGAN